MHWPGHFIQASYCECVAVHRPARIDRESVNSVALDDEPQNPNDRLMVACFVGLNPGGTTVMARDTTILPNIPGLPALMALLFCPTAELRYKAKPFYDIISFLKKDPILYDVIIFPFQKSPYKGHSIAGQSHGCWCPGSLCHHAISSPSTLLVLQDKQVLICHEEGFQLSVSCVEKWKKRQIWFCVPNINDA